MQVDEKGLAQASEAFQRIAGYSGDLYVSALRAAITTYLSARSAEPVAGAYRIAEPESGFRSHGSFTPGEKAKLRPIAETLAMLDGNAFFGMSAGDLEDWSDQYLPEAAALYDANGGDGGWAGKASFAAAIRKGPGE